MSQVTFYYGTCTQGPWTIIGNGLLTAGTSQSGTWALDWDVRNLLDGTYWVQVTAVDNLGAASQADYGRIIKDTMVTCQL